MNEKEWKAKIGKMTNEISKLEKIVEEEMKDRI